jgi:hypothetical protein
LLLLRLKIAGFKIEVFKKKWEKEAEYRETEECGEVMKSDG